MPRSPVLEGPGFNPRPRTGGDRKLEESLRLGPVSIHAPAREATANISPAVHVLPVSIHAPAREATRIGAGVAQPIVVSIHAPAREATAQP